MTAGLVIERVYIEYTPDVYAISFYYLSTYRPRI
jgi:hypothetical protein